MPVDLPVAAPIDVPIPPDSSKDLLTIQVSDQGNVYWNRELIDIDEVPARLEQWKKQVQLPRVLVAGDDRARWGVTVQVLDEVRKAKIEKVSMETRTRPTGR